MTCINYKFCYSKEIEGVKKNVVLVELYSSNTPPTLPTNAVNIEGFPDSYVRENVQFQAGSTLYVVDTGKVYIADETGTFVV